MSGIMNRGRSSGLGQPSGLLRRLLPGRVGTMVGDKMDALGTQLGSRPNGIGAVLGPVFGPMIKKLGLGGTMLDDMLNGTTQRKR